MEARAEGAAGRGVKELALAANRMPAYLESVPHTNTGLDICLRSITNLPVGVVLAFPVWRGMELSDHFIHAGLKSSKRKRLFKKGAWSRVPTHGLVVSEACPSGIHGHLAAISTPMKCRGHEAGRFADDSACDLGQYVDQPLLIGLIDMKHVDEDNHGIPIRALKRSFLEGFGHPQRNNKGARVPRSRTVRRRLSLQYRQTRRCATSCF